MHDAAITSPSKRFDYGALSSKDASELRTITKKVIVNKRRTTQYAIETGKELDKAKAKLPFRFFSRWCVDEAHLEPRTAQLFMNLAALAASYDRSKIERLPLSIAYLIAAPSAPPEIVTDVINAASQGSPPNVKDIKGRLRTARKAIVTEAEPKRPRIENQTVDGEADDIAQILMKALSPDQLERLAAYLEAVNLASLHKLGNILKHRINVHTKAPPKKIANLGLPQFGRVRSNER